MGRRGHDFDDLKYVFDNFTMPGNSQIPGYEAAARVLAKTGIYGPREYIKLVKNPILEDLRIRPRLQENRGRRKPKRTREKQIKEQEEASREKINLGSGDGSAVAKRRRERECQASV